MEQEKQEKVIKGLECIVSSGNDGMKDDCANCVYPGGGDCVAPALRDAIALLKAQEPVEPTIGRCEEYDGHDSWWYQCGKCQKPIDADDKYCRCCGQAVKWE